MKFIGMVSSPDTPHVEEVKSKSKKEVNPKAPINVEIKLGPFLLTIDPTEKRISIPSKTMKREADLIKKLKKWKELIKLMSISQIIQLNEISIQEAFVLQLISTPRLLHDLML